MTHFATRLLDRVNQGFSGGPQFNTLIVPLKNSHENRNADWSMPQHVYTADYALLDPRDRNAVLEAFWVMRGQTHTCQYKDWNDFKIVNQSLGTGDGTATPRQLVKTYTFGAGSLTRTITLPVADTLQVTANGSPLAVTVDPTNGLITPVSTWPSGQAIAVAYCEFDVKVRFGADHYPFTQHSEGVASCTVDLREVPR